MARGRRIANRQTYPLVSLAVADYDIWNRARNYAVNNGQTLASVVEAALKTFLVDRLLKNRSLSEQ